MKYKITKKDGTKPLVVDYPELLADIVSLLEMARKASSRTINAIMTATYWTVGWRIVEHEQGGKVRAEYGDVLLKTLAQDLTVKFGRGYGWRNLFQMRAFYLAYSGILQTPSAISSGSNGISQTPYNQSIIHSAGTRSGILQTVSAISDLHEIARHLPLSWSAYVRLLSVKDKTARRFYEEEALRGGWVVRQLDRQINSMFYERTALSRDKASMLKKGAKALPGDSVTPEEEIKDPLLLEFLGLKDEYSESDLEEALIHRLEDFLLELGGDFTFVGRQRRLRIGDEWYRVDLLFFHRRLRCLVVIDLKLGKFTHADAGQMHLYLNYAREHWTRLDENPPVGLILCAQKDDALAKYALEGLPNKVLAAEYKTALPSEQQLATELNKARRSLEKRKK